MRTLLIIVVSVVALLLFTLLFAPLLSQMLPSFDAQQFGQVAALPLIVLGVVLGVILARITNKKG